MKFQFKVSMNKMLISVLSLSWAASVSGLTELGKKMRLGRVAGMLGTAELDNVEVVGAASGSLRVSDTLVIGGTVVKRFVAVI
jgi:hypothetical protein